MKTNRNEHLTNMHYEIETNELPLNVVALVSVYWLLLILKNGHMYVLIEPTIRNSLTESTIHSEKQKLIEPNFQSN